MNTTVIKRFFHIRGPRTGKAKYNGATVYVVGDTERVGQVDVQVSFCSRKDMFCRKIGREEALKAPLKVVPLRYLSRELANIEDEVYGHPLDNNDDFLFAIKYFLPKE